MLTNKDCPDNLVEMGWEDAIYGNDVEPHPCRATIKVHKPPQFQERLQYIDKRYDHLRKLTQALKRKINELEDIMNQDNDEGNVEIIQNLLAEIKRERQLMRDEAHIIKGELSQAMYNEDLRSKILNFISQFESLWFDDEKKLTGEYTREQRAGTSQDGDDPYTPSSSEGLPFRETSF